MNLTREKKLLLVMKTELKAKRISNDGMSNFLIFNTFIRFEVICLMVLHENGLIVWNLIDIYTYSYVCFPANTIFNFFAAVYNVGKQKKL